MISISSERVRVLSARALRTWRCVLVTSLGNLVTVLVTNLVTSPGILVTSPGFSTMICACLVGTMNVIVQAIRRSWARAVQARLHDRTSVVRHIPIARSCAPPGMPGQSLGSGSATRPYASCPESGLAGDLRDSPRTPDHDHHATAYRHLSDDILLEPRSSSHTTSTWSTAFTLRWRPWPGGRRYPGRGWVRASRPYHPPMGRAEVPRLPRHSPGTGRTG